MLSKISSLPFLPLCHPGLGLCSVNVYWTEEGSYPGVSPPLFLDYFLLCNKSPFCPVLIFLMSPLTSPMLETSTFQCSPPFHSFFFQYNIYFLKLRRNIRVNKAYKSWVYSSVTLRGYLDQDIDHFPHPEPPVCLLPPILPTKGNHCADFSFACPWTLHSWNPTACTLCTLFLCFSTGDSTSPLT